VTSIDLDTRNSAQQEKWRCICWIRF